MSDEDKKTDAAAEPAAVGQPAVPAINWDDSEMRTSYANVVNTASTREEVTLFFGTNLTWNPNDAKEFKVKLQDRVVISPYAAKRLWILLGTVLKNYENQFGELRMDALAAAAKAANKSRQGDGE